MIDLSHRPNVLYLASMEHNKAIAIWVSYTKKIIAILQPALKDLCDAMDGLPGGKVSGVIISSSFNSLSHYQRQKKLSKILEAGLTKDELLSVGATALLTPNEAKVSAA